MMRQCVNSNNRKKNQSDHYFTLTAYKMQYGALYKRGKSLSKQNLL